MATNAMLKPLIAFIYDKPEIQTYPRPLDTSDTSHHFLAQDEARPLPSSLPVAASSLACRSAITYQLVFLKDHSQGSILHD